MTSVYNRLQVTEAMTFDQYRHHRWKYFFENDVPYSQYCEYIDSLTAQVKHGHIEKPSSVVHPSKSNV